MVRKFLLSCMLLIFVSTFSAFSQEDLSVYSAGKLKKLGTKALQNKNSYGAIRYFEEFLKIKEDPAIMYLLAESYRFTRNYPFAQYWYDKAYKANPKKNGKALYYYAAMLKTSQMYSEAQPQFKQFKKEYVDFDDSEKFQKLTKQQMIACDTAPGIIKNPVQVRVNHLGSSINNEALEIMPIYVANNSMIYGALPFDTVTVSDSVARPTMYGATKSGFNWQNSGEWDLKAENTPNIYMSQGAFSSDFQRFYFTRCQKVKKSGTVCKVYVSKNTFGVWQAPEELPEIVNGKGFSNVQIAVGNESKKNDEVLYFISDRPGGQGGLDIWFSIYMAKKNEWREPKNCGNKVNSAGDEVSPYFDPLSRSLYFSSNGIAGLGEFDIFKSSGELGKWTPSENLGYPINSPADDYYFTLSPDGKSGLFSSNRVGSIASGHETCCDDIYSVEFVNVFEIPVAGKVFEIEDKEIKSLLNKNFESAGLELKTDSLEMKYVKGSTVTLHIGNTNEKVFVGSTETDSLGRYYFKVEPNKNYVLQFENIKTGTAFIPFSTKGKENSDTLFIKDYGINFISKDAMVMKNIYYEYGKYKLTKEQKETIDSSLVTLMKQAPEIVIELESHTDNQGSEDFNMKLSQKRADEIVDYVVKQGVDPKRISGKGFGYSVPVDTNVNEDGSDNPQGRAKNRRTEFRIVGSMEQLNNGDVDTEVTE